MREASLKISERPVIGSSNMRRLRKGGFLPAVVYAAGEKTVHASVPAREFITLAQKSSLAQLFSFTSESSALNGKLAIVKEIQKGSLKGEPLHIDFQTLKENEKITVKIPVHTKGEAPGVKLDGGVLSQAAHEISVNCLPRKIPDHIEVDISELKIGSSIHLKDLKLPEGVEIVGDLEETLLSVVQAKAYVAETPVAATTEVAAAEGAAAPAAEGAAPAEGAAAAGKEGGKDAAQPAKKGKE